MSIVLNWASAHCDALDLANRQMRSAGRKKWNAEDADAHVARLEHLACVFYRHCYDGAEYGPIDLREAWMLLASTKPDGIVIFTANGRSRRIAV